MAVFGKKRFGSGYQRRVGMQSRSLLQENSKELVSVLKIHGVIEDGIKIFEIGAGPGRNLKYINDENNTVGLYLNDLWKDASYKYMDKLIKDKTVFYEMDTFILINDCKPEFQVDLLISSDHLMHIEYEPADIILKGIRDSWKPNYILLREVKKEFESPDHPRLFHDYNQLLTDYDLVYETTSVNAKEYFIWLLKGK